MQFFLFPAYDKMSSKKEILEKLMVAYLNAESSSTHSSSHHRSHSSSSCRSSSKNESSKSILPQAEDSSRAQVIEVTQMTQATQAIANKQKNPKTAS